MNWGSVFQEAYQAASETEKQAANAMMSSAKAAAEAISAAARAVGEGAIKAGQAAERTAVAVGEEAVKVGQAAGRAAVAVGEEAVKAGQAAGRAAVAVGTGVGNVAGFGTRVIGNASGLVASAALSSLQAPYLAAKELLSPNQTPQQTVVQTCPDTWPAKKHRMQERQQLIANGHQPGASPPMKAAADRLQRNNEVVELARLSDDTYAQYGNPPKNDPPLGWQRVSDEELQKKGIDLDLLEKSQAVIYRTAPDWPGGQKTVLAFRGTADQEDVLVDYDQALSVPTAQYKNAASLGRQVPKAFGPDVLVTGHSLGGGKAQAAGTMGGLKGMMFNSAGLNPDTLKGVMPAPDQFVQYRAPYDPLTGSQNSPLVQAGAVGIAGGVGTPVGVAMKIGDAAAKALGFTGLSPEWEDYADKAAKAFPRAMRNLWEHGDPLPPAVGKIEEVPSLDNQGKTVAPYNVGGQHSITNLVNGIESQKSEDVTTLRGG